MMEFVRNCYAWFIENYKEITMVITSTQFISLIGTLVMVVKTKKTTSDNTDSSNKLKNELKLSLDSNTKLLNDVQSLSLQNDSFKAELNEIKKENVKLKNQIAKNQMEIVDFLNTQGMKFNTILEVQSIVYSTIKDEKIRNTVNSLLVNAKYCETTSRAKLQQEVEELREKVAEKMNEVTQDVDKTVNAVKGIVNPESNDNLEVSEIDDSQNLVRY